MPSHSSSRPGLPGEQPQAWFRGHWVLSTLRLYFTRDPLGPEAEGPLCSVSGHLGHWLDPGSACCPRNLSLVSLSSVLISQVPASHFRTLRTLKMLAISYSSWPHNLVKFILCLWLHSGSQWPRTDNLARALRFSAVLPPSLCTLGALLAHVHHCLPWLPLPAGCILFPPGSLP